MNLSLKMLFEPEGDNPPFFKSQRELARILCEYRGCGAEKVQSTTVFLNSIIQGKKRLPKEWKEQLRIIMERRAKELGMDASRVSALFASVERASSSKSDLGVLLAEQAEARDTLILNACPLELSDAKSEHDEALVLQHLVFTALETGRRYRYCVANQTNAHRLWDALLHTADERYPSEASERVRDWAKKSRLIVSVVPELLLLHPTVAYNSSAPDRLKVFVWHAPYDWENALAIPTQQTVAWLGKIQNVLDTQSQVIEPPS